MQALRAFHGRPAVAAGVDLFALMKAYLDWYEKRAGGSFLECVEGTMRLTLLGTAVARGWLWLPGAPKGRPLSLGRAPLRRAWAIRRFPVECSVSVCPGL